MTKSKNWGGSRDGSGRKALKGETKTLRIPIHYEREIKEFIDFLCAHGEPMVDFEGNDLKDDKGNTRYTPPNDVREVIIQNSINLRSGNRLNVKVSTERLKKDS